ncbi:MAG: hypothetical protein K8F91_09655 [Candidatus Obscuribacterales bacterium]|nr:hypothetical protein [Candidatus Obscuribacterales bacterium]
MSIDTYGNIGWVTTHEAGHWLEYYYRSKVESADHTVVGSRIYKDLIDQDWVNFNELVDCGIGGIFNGRKSWADIYICSGGFHTSLPMNQPYTGASSNKSVMWLGYSSIFTDNAEIFATLVARTTGYSDTNLQRISGFASSAKFSCTMYLVGKLIQDGELPTITQLDGISQPGGGDTECPTSGTDWPDIDP